MHPLTRVILVIWITAVAVLLLNPLYLLCLLALAVLLGLIFSRAKVLSVITNFSLILSLVGFIFLVQVLFRRGGETLWSWGFLSVNSEGLLLGLQVSLRLLVIIFSATILSSLSYSEFRLAFRHLPEEISFLISYTLHLIPILRLRLAQYRQSLRQRGLDYAKLKLGQKLQIYRVLSLSLLGSLIHSASAQAIALELRGFRRQGKKSFLCHRSYTWVDLTIYLMLAALSALLIAL